MLKVALTNLGKYVDGELDFIWLELPFTQEEFNNALEKIEVVQETKYEEYFITDYDTDIQGLEIGEYQNLKVLNELIKRYENFDDYDKEVIQAIVEAGENLELAIEKVENAEAILYYVSDEEELARMFLDDGYFGDLSGMENLIDYIDYETLGRDIMIQGNYCKVNSGIIFIE